MSHEKREDIFDRQAGGQNLADIARSMDWISADGVLIANGNRMRTTLTQNLLATRFAYNEQPDLFQVVENVNGSLTYLPNEDAIRLSIGTSAGDKIVHSTNEFFHYQSYRETQFGRGFVLPEQQDGVRSRCGAFYDDNGFYFQYDENNQPAMVRRSKASGTVVNHVVQQDDWNVNTFKAGDNHIKNPSGIVLDFDKAQMWKGGLLWYGQGYIYQGFQIGKKIYIAHVFQGANLRREPIIGEPTLPLRLELENISGVASSPSIKTWGASAAVETGQFKDVGFIHTISNQLNSVSTNPNANGLADLVRVLTIRPKATFKGKPNRTKIEPLTYSINVLSEPHFYIVARNAAMDNADTLEWDSVGNESAVEYSYDVTGNDPFTGSVRVEDYVTSTNKGGGAFSRDADTRNPLVINADGTQGGENLSVFAISNTNQGDEVQASFRWLEIQ